MESVLKLLSEYGNETTIIALLILIILWFMRLVSKLVNIDKRLDDIENKVTGNNANQSVIIEFMKAFMFPNNSNNADNQNKKEE